MDAKRTERRLAAILAADIVGYSRLIEADEATTLAAIQILRAEVIDPLLAKHKGRIAKLMGDGAIIEFGSVVDAVTCAVEMQIDVASHQASVPANRRIVFRFGINLGDVVVEGDDLLGDGVNVAARLEQLCDPGGVLVSGTAYDQLQGKIALPLDFIGEQQVKNISRPVRAYRVRMFGTRRRFILDRRRLRRLLPMTAGLVILLLMVAVGAWWFRPGDTVSAKPSIAVLPFDNLGGDEATGRLANGITEDIITDLARFPEFEVVARNSTEVFKDKAVDVRQVGKDLDVEFILEGSIQHEGDRVRLTAQLIEAKSGKHVWSERWDRPDNDVFAIQSEIAEQVTNRMGGGAGLIQTAGREAARRQRPDDLTAYELYLLGTEKLEQISAANNAEALRLLTRAVELDPGLARAWVELSHAHGMAVQFGASRTEGSKSAMAAAERAVTLDPSDAEAYVALAMRLGDKGEFARAEAAFDTALALSPGAAEILTFYAGYASSFGKPERGAEVVDRVIRLNPNFPTWNAGPFSYAYFMAGRYKDVVRLLERVPPENYTRNRWVFRAGSNAALGRAAEAQAAVKQALDQFPDLTIEGIVSDPSWTDAERQKLIETMRQAGFPPCAKPEGLKQIEKPTRLPECKAQPPG